LQDAIRRQLERGIQIGPQAELAGEVARLVCAITGVERVAFASSGTEAVMTALRLARARTGRPKIALFAGSYHGSFDGVLGAIPLTLGAPPGIAEDVLVLEYGQPSALETLREHASEIAGVLVEPVQGRRPELQPAKFLEQLRELTRACKMALIFDEVLLGFRIHLAGAQAWFGVEADLVTYGKILGGGMPIGAVAGKAEYLDFLDGGAWQYGDASTPTREQIWFAGTFNKNPLAMATSQAALEHLRAEGPALQHGLNLKTDALARELNGLFSSRGVDAAVTHFGSLFRFRLPKNLDLFYHHLIARGIYVWEGRSLFLSTAHRDRDLEQLIEAVRSATDSLCTGGFLAEPPRARALSATRQAEPPLRVFCLPDAGGTGQHFQRWAEALDGAVELELIALPGRDGQAPYAMDFSALVRAIVKGLRPSLDRPFALYGHSMGGLLAFEIARLLRRERALEPAMLFVSGEPAPQLERNKLPENWMTLPDDTLLLELSRVGVVPALCTDPALMRDTLPLLRKDLALCASYRYTDEAPLSCPISAFAGRTDPLASQVEVAAWAEQSSGDFALRLLPGDHAFARREWKALTGCIRSDAERLWRERDWRASDARPMNADWLEHHPPSPTYRVA
jgi:glutamate-1-semialdehyde aminotransferase/surfactin synthase thioesterase subunit